MDFLPLSGRTQFRRQPSALPDPVSEVKRALPGPVPGVSPVRLDPVPAEFPTVPGPVLEAPAASLDPVPDANRALPGPVPGASLGLPDPVPEVFSALPGPVLEASPASLDPVPDATSVLPGPVPGTFPATPNHTSKALTMTLRLREEVLQHIIEIKQMFQNQKHPSLTSLKIMKSRLWSEYHTYNRLHAVVIGLVPEESLSEQEEEYWTFESLFNQVVVPVQEMLLAKEKVCSKHTISKPALTSPSTGANPATLKCDFRRPMPMYGSTPPVLVRDDQSKTSVIADASQMQSQTTDEQNHCKQSLTLTKGQRRDVESDAINDAKTLEPSVIPAKSEVGRRASTLISEDDAVNASFQSLPPAVMMFPASTPYEQCRRTKPDGSHKSTPAEVAASADREPEGLVSQNCCSVLHSGSVSKVDVSISAFFKAVSLESISRVMNVVPKVFDSSSKPVLPHSSVVPNPVEASPLRTYCVDQEGHTITNKDPPKPPVAKAPDKLHQWNSSLNKCHNRTNCAPLSNYHKQCDALAQTDDDPKAPQTLTVPTHLDCEIERPLTRPWDPGVNLTQCDFGQLMIQTETVILHRLREEVVQAQSQRLSGLNGGSMFGATEDLPPPV